MTLPDASIIILTKNGGDNFPKLLERIFNQQYNGKYEVTVIDSGSTDGTIEIAGRYSVRLIHIKPEQFHHSKTRNLGADMATGRYLVYITQDALPLAEDWLQKLLKGFSDPQVAMVVGRQIPWENTKPPEKFFYYYNFPDFRLVVKSDDEDYYHDNVFISDVNSAYTRDVFQRLRFKEDIVMAEDKEIAARILADGWKIVYEPTAAIYHAHDHGIRDVFSKWYNFGLALRQGASNLPKSKKAALTKSTTYFLKEMNYLYINKYCKWAPYSMAYEISKYTGLFLGKINFRIAAKSLSVNTDL